MRAFSGVTDYRNGGIVNEDITDMETLSKQREAEKEIARLKQEFKAERMRADLWQKVVEIAEDATHNTIWNKRSISKRLKSTPPSTLPDI